MHLRILHKLLLGYAFYLAIAISFGVYVYGNIGQIRVKQRLVEIADDARDDVLELRRNEKNYIIRRDQEYLDNIHSISNGLRELVSNLGPDIKAAFGKDDYQSLLDSLLAYSSLVDKFSANYKTENELSEELRGVGRGLEDTILRYSDPKLTRQALEVRLLEKNYILFKDRKYMEELKARVTELREGIKSAPARKKCEDYLALADRLVDNTGKEAVLLGLVQDSAKKMQGIIEKVAGRERSEINGYLVSSQSLLLGALLLLASLGPLIMWFLAKAISSPLRKLEAAARKISEGEVDLRVKSEGDVETRSLQKSFNAMLDKLQQSHESLEHTVRLLHEKNAQLIESEKLASIGVLASGVAHEINNPLANISLTAETILDAHRGISEDELAALTRDIIEQTERAKAVVTNLLSYARSRRDLTWDELDIREAVARAVRLVSHHVRLHDASITEDMHDRPLMIKGNRGKLEQVFVNIIINALHAMRQGGTVGFMVGPDEAGEHAVVEIKDTGPGIPEENLKRIFDPFFTTKSIGEGTGLGLYISYGIVKDHGGEIEVESEEGKGTLFRVILPMLRGQGEAA